MGEWQGGTEEILTSVIITIIFTFIILIIYRHSSSVGRTVTRTAQVLLWRGESEERQRVVKRSMKGEG